MKKCHIPLLVIAAFTLLQLVVLVVFGYTPYPDSDGYLNLARECVTQGEPYPTHRQLAELPFIWNMGAINAVYCSLRLFGTAYPLLVVYSVLKGVTAWLVYKTAERLANTKTALIALTIYVLYLPNYGEGTSFHSELPFTFLCMLAFWLMVCKQRFVWGGIVLAIANWVRPFALVFLVAMLVYLLLFHKQRLRRIVQLSASYAVAVCFIGAGCFLRTGHFLYQAKTGWMALMQYHWDHDTDQQSDRHLFACGDPTKVPDECFNYQQRDSLWHHNFFKWLPDNKGEYARQIPYKVMKTYVSDNCNLCALMNKQQKAAPYMYAPISMERLRLDFPHYQTIQWLTVYNLLFYYILMLLTLLSIGKVIRNKPLWIFVIIPLLGTIFIALVGHGETRFHQPFMPFLIILAAIRLTTWLRIKKGRSF